jgi:hypothetical protein
MPTALSNPYCTLEDVKSECKIASTDRNDVIAEAINSASRGIDERCRRDFLFHDHASTAYRVPSHCIAENKLFLLWPVITLTEVKLVASDGTETVLDPGDYEFENGGVCATITRDGRWLVEDGFTGDGLAPRRTHTRPPRIYLKGTFGYTWAAATAPAATLPFNIRRACTVIASVWSGLSMKQIVGAGGTVETVSQKTIPKEALELLSKYELPLT